MAVKDQDAQRASENAAVYVVVTIADNGVVHAWGEGPAHDPDGSQVVPILGRSRARMVAAKFRREERARLEQPGETGSVQVKVCRVLGIEPVEVKVDAPAG